MPQGGWVPLRTSWTPSTQRSSEHELQRALFAPRFWETADASRMPITNPLRRWRRPELPPVDAPFLPDDEGYGGAGAAGANAAHADFINPMASPFGRDAVQHSHIRWDDDGDTDSQSAAGKNPCAHPASCLPPLLHRRRHSSAASVSRSRSGGSAFALQSLSSRRLAAAAAAVPESPDNSPTGGPSKHTHQEDMSQASDWLFGDGARPDFLQHPNSWSTVQLADAAAVDHHYSPLPAGPSRKAGIRAASVRRRLCCCIAPSAVQQ